MAGGPVRHGGAHHLAHLRGGQRVGEGSHSRVVGGWFLAEHARQRHGVPAVLLGGDDAGPGPARHRVGERAGQPVEVVRFPPVAAGDVGDADLHLLLGRRAIAQFLQPDRGSRTPAAGVDHQVGGQHLLDAAGPPQPHPGDPAAVGGGGQAQHLDRAADPHAGQGRHPGAQRILQQRPAHAHRDQRGRRTPHPVAVVVPVHVTVQVDQRRTTGVQLGGHPGEQLVQCLLAAGEQHVQLPALRHRPRAAGRSGSTSRSRPAPGRSDR